MACSNSDLLVAAVVQGDAQMVPIDDLRHAVQVPDLAILRQLAGSVGEPRHDLLLEVAKLVEIDRSARRTATPHAAAWRDSLITFATWSSAFDGIQPR